MSIIAIISFIAAIVAIGGLIFNILNSAKAKDVYMEEMNGKLLDLTSEKAALEMKLKSKEEFDKQRQQEMQERFETELKHLKETFLNLTSENSRIFKNQSSESIAEILKPIQEKFIQFDKSVRETQTESAKQASSLKTYIEEVMKQSKTVGDEARNLANALTGYSKVQGDFGEMLLTDVLKNSGMTEGIHFITQGTIRDEGGHEIKSDTGASMIPDVMILYPDNTTVIVDSKTSLTAYKEYINAESIEDRERLARLHVESIRKHVDELKKKDYASYIPEKMSKVDYNIMFIPIEGAFRLMLDADPLLWQVAKDNKVLIVSQMTLIIVLNMIQMSWKQYDQEKNIAQVYQTAEELMSQIKGWLESFINVGSYIEKAAKAYDDSKKKLEDSNQSVIKKISKLEKLGINPKRSQGKIKTSGRMIGGRESVIPQEFDLEEI